MNVIIRDRKQHGRVVDFFKGRTLADITEEEKSEMEYSECYAEETLDNYTCKWGRWWNVGP